MDRLYVPAARAAQNEVRRLASLGLHAVVLARGADENRVTVAAMARPAIRSETDMPGWSGNDRHLARRTILTSGIPP